jgi:alpha-1,2-mannosyltransferase
VALALAALIALFNHNMRTSPFDDFEEYYATATAVHHGESPYARALLVRDAGYSMGHPTIPRPSGNPYFYPPPMAVALVPLTALPFEAARLVWLAFNYSVVIATSLALMRLFVPGHREWWLPAAAALSAALALFQPIRAGLFWGQIDIFLLLSLTLVLFAFVHRRDHLAGFWLGLAIVVKPFLGLLLLFFLWKRAFRVVAAACLVSAAVLGASLLVVGPHVMLEFVSAALYTSGPVWAVSPGNQSPYGFLLRLFSPNAFTAPILELPVLVSVVRGGLVVAVVALLAVLISPSRSIPVRRQALEYGLVIVGTLLISPIAQANHYAYLAIPLVALAATLGADRPRSPGQMVLLIGLWLYLSLPGLQAWSFGLYSYHDGPIPAPKLLLTGAHLYALCALAVLTMVALYRSRRATVPSARTASLLVSGKTACDGSHTAHSSYSPLS